MEYGTHAGGGSGGEEVGCRRNKRLAAAAVVTAGTLACLAAALPAHHAGGPAEDLQPLFGGSIILQNERATLSQPPYPYAASYAAALPWGQLPVSVRRAPARQSGRPVVHPTGYYHNVPVWNELKGAAYLDQPQLQLPPPRPLFSFGAPPSLVQQSPQPLNLPAASAVERYLLAQHVPAQQGWQRAGLAVGLTGSAAAQYGAAYGAAFASTYNNLMAQQGMALKQPSLDRLQLKARKAAAAKLLTSAAAPAERTRIQITAPAPGWRMPPLTRTGTAVVEQALMPPSEVQQDGETSGTTVDIMSATGGPTFAVSKDVQPQQAGHPAPPPPLASSWSDPLETAQGAVQQAEASTSMSQPTSSLAELV